MQLVFASLMVTFPNNLASSGNSTGTPLCCIRSAWKCLVWIVCVFMIYQSSDFHDIVFSKKNDLANGFFNHSAISNFQAKAMGVIAISKIIGTTRCNGLHCICRCSYKIFHILLQIVKHYHNQSFLKKTTYGGIFFMWRFLHITNIFGSLWPPFPTVGTNKS